LSENERKCELGLLVELVFDSLKNFKRMTLGNVWQISEPFSLDND